MAVTPSTSGWKAGSASGPAQLRVISAPVATLAMTGIDQQAVMHAGCLAIIVLVVQHPAVGVDPDDVGVGQLALALAGGTEIGELDIQLGAALQETAPGGSMAR